MQQENILSPDMAASIETWKAIKGYEGLYEISNTGKVKRLFRNIRCVSNRVDSEYTVSVKEKILSPVKVGSARKKYLAVGLRDKNGNRKLIKIHRLVAENYIPNPNNYPQIDHIDGNKENNSVSNLEWVSSEENYSRAIFNGLANPKGESNGNSKLTAEQVETIRKTYKKGDRNSNTNALAKKYGVNRSTISRIISGRNWKSGKE